MGIQRRKNDAIDAVRIAEYARKNYASIRLWKPVDDALEQLKLLSGIRKRLLKARVMLKGSESLEKYFTTNRKLGLSTEYLQLTLQSIDTDLQTIAATASQLIRGDSHLSRLMDIVTYIPGVGPVIADELILQTGAFDTSWTAKRFASEK
jgi:transposase